MELRIRIVELYPNVDFFKKLSSDKLSMFFICGNISFKIEDIEKNIQNKESIIVILNQTKLTLTPIKFTLLFNDMNILGIGQLIPKSDIQWQKITTFKRNSPNVDEIKIKFETLISHCFNNKNIHPKNISKENSNVSAATTTSMKNLKLKSKISKINHYKKKLENTISFTSKKKHFYTSQSQKKIANNIKNEKNLNIETLTTIPVQEMDIGWLSDKEKNHEFLMENLGTQILRKNLDCDNNIINEFDCPHTVTNTENFKSPKSNKFKKRSTGSKNSHLRRSEGQKTKQNFSKSQKFLYKEDIKKFKTIYGFNKINNNHHHTNRHRSQKEIIEQDNINSGYKTQKNKNNFSALTNRCYNINKCVIKNNNQPNINLKIEEQIIDQKFKEKLINDVNIRDNSFSHNNINNTENNATSRNKNTRIYHEKMVSDDINQIESNLLNMQFNESQMLSNLDINAPILKMLIKYEKIKNDLFLIYNNKRIKHIKKESLIHELEYMLQKIFDLQKQYQNISINFQQEYNNSYKIYKNNQKQYILMNKKMRKLNDKILKYILDDERNNLFENVMSNVYYNYNTIKRNSDFNLWNNIIENLNALKITNNNSFIQKKNKLKNLFMDICEKNNSYLSKLNKCFYINLKSKTNDSMDNMDNASNKQSTNVDNYSIPLEEETTKHKNKTKSIEIKNYNYEKNFNIRNKFGQKLKDYNCKKNNSKNILIKKNNKDDNKSKNVITSFSNRKFGSLDKKSLTKTGASLQNSNKKRYFNK